MAEAFDKILALGDSENVRLADDLKELLNKELCFGMTRYVCRNGTLGASFERLTSAQKYYQAIREIWTYSREIKNMKAMSMKYQADLIDAEEKMGSAKKKSDKLRAESSMLIAKENLLGALVKIEDLTRVLDEFVKVYKELQPEVREKYPEGIEQAEPDNWKAVAKYRLYRIQQGDNQNLMSLPIPIDEMAEMGISSNRLDLLAPMLVTDKEKAAKIEEDMKRVEYMSTRP